MPLAKRQPAPAIPTVRTPTSARRTRPIAPRLEVTLRPADDENLPEASLVIPLSAARSMTVALTRETVADDSGPCAYSLYVDAADGRPLTRAELDTLAAVFPPLALLRDALIEDFKARSCAHCGTYHAPAPHADAETA